jgi:aspartate aminotransferase
MELSRQAQKISASVTLAITDKAKKLKDEGIDIISFGAGEPDFNTPQNIQAAAIEAIKNGFTRYTNASGIIELKAAICNKLLKDNNLLYKNSQIVVSNGAKHSLFNALCAICNPLDEVIVPVPYWVSYPELVKLANGVPVLVETTEEENFKYTKEKLERAITSKTKAIILNSPNNPTGVVYTIDEMNMIAELAEKHDFIIISDEIYEKLIYGDIKHYSIASISESIKNRTIVINGMSKAYAMTGWRIGYTAANETITKIMANIQSHTASNPNSIAQYASVEALTGPQEDVNSMRAEFEKRRDYMVMRINKIKSISCKNPHGAFYVMINITELIGKNLKGYNITNSVDLCDALITKAHVAVIPGSAFGADNFIRLSYATSMKNIENGLNRIEEFLKQ